MRLRSAFLMLAVLFSSLATAAQARAEAGLSLSLGGGMTADPRGGLLVISAPFGLGGAVSIGPEVQLLIEDDFLLTTATGTIQVATGRVGPIGTFLKGGLGVAHVSIDQGGSDDDDTSFLLNFGVGASLPIGPLLTLRSAALINVIPDSGFGDEFFFSWQILGLRLRF